MIRLFGRLLDRYMLWYWRRRARFHGVSEVEISCCATYREVSAAIMWHLWRRSLERHRDEVAARTGITPYTLGR